MQQYDWMQKRAVIVEEQKQDAPSNVFGGHSRAQGYRHWSKAVGICRMTTSILSQCDGIIRSFPTWLFRANRDYDTSRFQRIAICITLFAASVLAQQ